MTRKDHQPDMQPVERLRHAAGELREVCGSTVAVVLALETGTTPLMVPPERPGGSFTACEPPEGQGPVARPLQEYEGAPVVRWAVRAACRACMQEVFVLCDPALVEGVSRAVAGLGRASDGDGPDVTVVEADLAAIGARTRELRCLELFGLPAGLLEVGRDLAKRASGACDQVMFLQSDMVRVTEEHLYELCADARSAEFDAIASWISWQRRAPYVFAMPFLDGFAESGLAGTGPNGCDRPVPRLAARDHVFGEEMLAANAVARPGVQRFFDTCSMSALQAVQLARYSIGHPDEKLVSPNQELSLMGPVAPRPLGLGDELLVRAAKELLESKPESVSAEDLSWADGFGRECKRDFPLLNDRAHGSRTAYLDSAATTQRVDVAVQAQRDYDLHENANVYRGTYGLSAQSTFTFNDARKVLEDHLGAKRRQTVFTANTTTAINLVAQAWGEWNIAEGDVIVLPQAEHHSNMLPFVMLAQRKGARVVYVPYGADGRIDRAAYGKALKRGPKLVCMAQVGNVFGICAPVRELARQAHDAGARFLLDAAQSFAHMPLRVDELGVDWVAMSAHKAYGPMGIGALWIAPEAFAEMDPVGGGGGTVSHVGLDSYYLRPLALQYELGTPPVSQAIGWAAAIGYLEGLGMDCVARHDAALTRYLVEGLRRIDGVTVIGDHSAEDGATGLVSFAVCGIAPGDVAGFLGKLGVDIRGDGHCALPLHAAMGLVGTARISIGAYTTRDDIDAALVAVRACREAYR